MKRFRELLVLVREIAMPEKVKHKRYRPPKKQDALFVQISHDLAEKTKKVEREGCVQEM